MNLFQDRITIGKENISKHDSVFIIAEVSANHNNDINRAKEIILQAKLNGANAVKFQTYTPDTITLNSDKPEFLINGGLWDNRTLYDIYSEGSLNWGWHSELFDYARSLGLVVISSPFDETAVDFLVDLAVDALKIASFEINHIPLIRKAAKTGLPLIISTGMASESDMEEIVSVLQEENAHDVVFLHCISSYPAKAEDYNLKSIEYLSNKFGSIVGLSDHCLDNVAAIASVSLGVSVIEKHFTLDRDGGGLDDSFSLEPSDLKVLRQQVDIVKDAMSWTGFGCGKSEHPSLLYRRSIYASKPIKKGDIFTQDNIKVVRPSKGLHPRYYSDLLGQKAKRDIDFAEPIDLKDL